MTSDIGTGRGQARRDDALPALPGWLEALLPPHRTPVVLGLAPDRIALELRFPHGTVTRFASLRDAGEAAHASGLDLGIDADVYTVHGTSRLGGLGLSYPSGRGGGYTTLVLASTDADRHRRLREGYRGFLNAADDYEREPSDMVGAWRFVDRHPAFWTAPDLEARPWHWDQDGYCSRILQSVWREGEEFDAPSGPVRVTLEAGAHVPEDRQRGTRYRDHYADWRLEVTSVSFEEAFLILADRVHQCFTRAGDSRPDAETGLAEPAWIAEVRRRLADADHPGGR